ncbi:MAG: type II toxin-antitoxin system RelB/DinJ family antitoxin [Oscillospiraceae bacterium]|nr:type II toxin-antitoxin system RelB/DinJ family antitoxin [Oscillospiraceae bacterium]
MSEVDLSIKIDEDDKTSLEDFADKIGLSVSALLNGIVKRIVAEQRVTFEALNIPNAETIEALEDSISGRNVRTYRNCEEMMEDLMNGED